MPESDCQYCGIAFEFDGRTYAPDEIRRLHAQSLLDAASVPAPISAFVATTLKAMTDEDVTHLADPAGYAADQIKAMPLDTVPLPWTPPTSFADLDAEQAAMQKAEQLYCLNDQFVRLAANTVHFEENPEAKLASLVDDYIDRLMAIKDSEPPDEGNDGESSDKANNGRHKRENGIDFPAADYAFVPDPDKPATWKLRLTETPGKVTLAQLARAAAALGAGGFRGQSVQLPDEVRAAVKRRVRAEYRKLGVEDNKIPAAVKELDPGFSIFKGEDGRYYWLAVYSNNFRDDDAPAQIISEKSQETFVALVDSGVVPPPELWHFHIPGSKWGEALWVDYISGFAVAFGTVDKGHEAEAEALQQYPGDLGVSHGMPADLLAFDPDDPSVILFHVTREISDLPWSRAANKHTGFWIKSEDDPMSKTLSAQKRQYLIDAGVDPAKIEDIEKGLATLSASLKDAVESKEASGGTPPADPPANDTPATPETVEPPDEPAQPSMKEMVETIIDIVSPLADAIKELTAEVVDTRSRLAALEATDSERLVKTASVTPAASLREMVLEGLFGKSAPVKGSDPAVKNAGPKETKPQPRAITGVGFLDYMAAEQTESDD